MYLKVANNYYFVVHNEIDPSLLHITQRFPFVTLLLQGGTNPLLLTPIQIMTNDLSLMR